MPLDSNSWTLECAHSRPPCSKLCGATDVRLFRLALGALWRYHSESATTFVLLRHRMLRCVEILQNFLYSLILFTKNSSPWTTQTNYKLDLQYVAQNKRALTIDQIKKKYKFMCQTLKYPLCKNELFIHQMHKITHQTIL